MKKNIRYNIVLLLLMVEAVLIPAFTQMPEIKLGQSISFEEYLNRVGKKNLSYLAAVSYTHLTLPTTPYV